MLTRTYLKDLIYRVNGAAIEVHKTLGPGLLESVYHKCMKRELDLRGIKFESEFNVPLNHKGVRVETDLRCDLFIEGVLPVELKAVETIMPVHEAQLLTYMQLLEAPIGLLLNFNSTHLFRHGQKTLVNDLYRTLWD
ncbi:MAG: GxxExxY protein [Flavobacteriia bacterium]|jgi:GxxExxY protein